MRTRFLLVLSVALAPAVAHASCHVMEIVEIFGGTDSEPDAHYVVLQMTAMGQGVVSGNTITTNGGTFATFAGNVANSANGSKILAATSQAATLFGIPADQTASGALDFPGGMVAHDCSLDSVTYGGGAIPALIRGCALKKSGGLWSLGDPSPENNAGGSAPLSTCVAPDGGLPEPVADPDMGSDAGESDDASDGGCGCRVGMPPSAGFSLFAVLALAVGARRRRS